MAPIKSQSPGQSPTREIEETESFDLYTPDTPMANESDSTPTNSHKRSRGASGAKTSSKRPCTAATRKKGNQSGSRGNAKPRAKAATAKVATIVIGLDYGTTHSGMSHAYSERARDGVTTFTVWDETNTDYVKIPSAIKFDNHDPPNVVWGIAAKDLPDAVRWFKLLLVNPLDLDEDIRASAQLQMARAALQALKMSPVQAISIFLKRMFEHALQELTHSLGQAIMDSSRFHFVITLPAIWPEYARRSMQEAVKRAGILEKRGKGQTTHDFVSEPEAASLATLSDLKGLPKFEIDDLTVVADCGGGTADVIAYKINDPNSMTVQEAVAGAGALCGEIFVAERFKELVAKKFEEKVADAMQRVTGEEWQDIMTRNWEQEIRNQFTGTARTWLMRLPYSLIDVHGPEPNGGRPTITITSGEVEEVFRPSVERIKSLVTGQVEAAVKKYDKLPKSLILVGGFGSSVYLRNYLKQCFPRLQVWQSRGSDPWSAISRGAVIHGMTKKKMSIPLKVAVRSRISRESCGIACEELWDRNVHHPEDKRLNPFLQKDVSIRVMKWHVRQGEEIPINHKLSICLTKYLDELPEKIVVVIYKSLTDQPSQRLDGSVMKATEITWTNIQIDWNSLQSFPNERNKTIKKLEYNIEMDCSAGATIFSIYHDGRKQAAKNVSLNFD